ncbi:MAG: hypothetical protein WDM81_19560 [Rhizomicrobium sp.]
MLKESLAAYDTALVHVKDPSEKLETAHSRAICLIGMGRLQEGFRDFEIRNTPRFRAISTTSLKRRGGRART